MTRLLPVGIYRYEDLGFNKIYPHIIQLIEVGDDDYEIQHFGGVFNLKRKDAFTPLKISQED